MSTTIAGGADTALTRSTIAPCSSSSCWVRSRSGVTASRSRCPAARRRSCWCTWRSQPGRPCARTGCSTTSGPASRPTATRCSRRSPGCAAASATGRWSPAATTATGSQVEPGAVDAHRVLRDVDTATALFDDGDHAAAAAATAAALALFRGDVLPAAGDWAAPQRARLEEARLQLIETGFAARLRLGRGRDRRARGRRRRRLPTARGCGSC